MGGCGGGGGGLIGRTTSPKVFFWRIRPKCLPFFLVGVTIRCFNQSLALSHK